MVNSRPTIQRLPWWLLTDVRVSLLRGSNPIFASLFAFLRFQIGPFRWDDVSHSLHYKVSLRMSESRC